MAAPTPPSRPAGPSQRLGLSQAQELRLEPRMLQSIQVLALPATDLDQWLRVAAEENEALRVEERAPGASAWRGSAAPAAGSGDKDGLLANVAAAEGGLTEALEQQLAELELDPVQRAWARLVVGALDARGYLVASDAELLAAAEADSLAGGAGALGRAIATVQGLEPRGVGGRDAVEALLLQLDPRDPDYALLAQLIEDFLEDVARNKLPAVARGLGVELERLGELLGQLRGLTLEPAGTLATADGVDVPLVPDLVVEPRGDGFEVRLASGNLAPVALDEGVLALARDRSQDPEVRRYLRDKVERARWIVDALALRERTLLRVAGVALERQRAFLVHGQGHLVPLAMGDVAALLGVHISTVSRAVAGKVVDTPHGLVPLRTFFQRRTGAADEPGADAGGGAQEEVQRLVRELVEAEDPDAPLSDQDLTAALEARGVRLSRRSVANVRRALDIPSSYRRRRYA